ncbi:hypothetical protein PAXRUDRAFT_830741 [Paxillus rubicundulus Ve08.2h10]|uniref:Uncharacterized protein n=1 Tax=Paxillus rubicundulus Ve08.2h10 TaxID=930991 RepID=A0A0D0D4P9_9AGAM|nr:hypothetical protein PAXRUDRAFT_830741 [Paxillus rubicundulus Ve08.2h10]
MVAGLLTITCVSSRVCVAPVLSAPRLHTVVIDASKHDRGLPSSLRTTFNIQRG